jgi:hypothetical protein
MPDRREFLKVGAGVLGTALSSSTALGQEASPGSGRRFGVPRVHTRAGYKTPLGRLGSNGPMDESSRRIVRFVTEFDENRLTEPVVTAFNRTMIDSMASIISGSTKSPCGLPPAWRRMRSRRPDG